MRKLLLALILISLKTLTFSEGEVIGLKNNVTKESSSSNSDNDFDNSKNHFQNELIFPKSIYIGELSDFKSIDINRNEIIKIIDQFIRDIKKNKKSDLLDPRFKFVFENLYKELLLDNHLDLIRWNIGYIDIYNSNAEATIELYYRENLFIGSIYVEKTEDWLISDLQLEEQERRVFDPSSPH